MIRALTVTLTPVTFGLMGMAAAYLDRGYSPVVCMFFGAVAGLVIGVVASAGERFLPPRNP